ncbi:MAG: transcriptional repressor [Thermoguttaceae bacterium]|nr:transcriptional repressor [Thermoguttaceae bacterium]MDW8077267.1 transcriptional repressor [Thermoguttaceae bacterium]
MTQKQEVIFRQIFSHHDHYYAEELLGHLRDGGGECLQVNRPTVYSTLAELVEAGLLQKITIGNRAVYEH